MYKKKQNQSWSSETESYRDTKIKEFCICDVSKFKIILFTDRFCILKLAEKFVPIFVYYI